jgi:uncharacterized protein (UPF0335 family)
MSIFRKKTLFPSGAAASTVHKFIERAERNAKEQDSLVDDMFRMYPRIKDRNRFLEIVQRFLELRDMNENEREEERQILKLYLDAVGL